MQPIIFFAFCSMLSIQQPSWQELITWLWQLLISPWLMLTALIPDWIAATRPLPWGGQPVVGLVLYWLSCFGRPWCTFVTCATGVGFCFSIQSGRGIARLCCHVPNHACQHILYDLSLGLGMHTTSSTRPITKRCLGTLLLTAIIAAYGVWAIWAADVLLETAMIIVVIIATITAIFGNRRRYGSNYDVYDN